MTFWVVVGLFCLAALWFAVWPLYRESRRLTPLLAIVVVFTVAFSAGVYNVVGSPNLPSAGAHSDGLQDMDAVMASLRQRLTDNPEDLNGWRMQARSQMALQQYADAATSFERIMALARQAQAPDG